MFLDITSYCQFSQGPETMPRPTKKAATKASTAKKNAQNKYELQSEAMGQEEHFGRRWMCVQAQEAESAQE